MKELSSTIVVVYTLESKRFFNILATDIDIVLNKYGLCMSTALNYTVFAAISILANISSQELSLYFYSGRYSLTVSIIVGTGTGLITKYLLDKRYIFNYQSKDISDDISKFVSYSITGIVTTLIFWGFEFGFEYLFHTKTARYTGAVIGLTIGYVIKYQLDYRYVFRRSVS